MILLIGHGYLSDEFQRQLRKAHYPFAVVTHSDCESFSVTRCFLDTYTPRLVINCAGYVPPASVEKCNASPEETIRGNATFPLQVSHACATEGIPFAQLSTGFLWDDGNEHTEEDQPKRGITDRCGMYITSKIMGEIASKTNPSHYIWRFHLPFDEFDCPKNSVSKLMRYPRIFNYQVSMTHRADFVRACLELWEKRAPWGTYHVCNEGQVEPRELVNMMHARGLLDHTKEFCLDENTGVRLNIDKLLGTGIKMRPVTEALADALDHWEPCGDPVEVSHV